MAYMNQEKKKRIANALKQAGLPKSLKYSLAVRNHSTIVMTIRSADIDFIKNFNDNLPEKDTFGNTPRKAVDYIDVNVFHYKSQFSGKALDVLEKIISCLNIDNYDNSDVMTDYFDVGYYVTLDIGRWNKPFVFTG